MLEKINMQFVKRYNLRQFIFLNYSFKSKLFTKINWFTVFVPVANVAINMSHPMGKPTICIGENKGADQLRGNREADQRLCFRYLDSTIPPLLNSKISSF